MSYYDLGPYKRPVTTTSPEAQVWFDRGLNWAFGFNFEAAVKCFARAAEQDPTCGMAHWGVAYASGPNYNLPWELQDPTSKAAALAASYDAMQKALACAKNATPVEQALINALPARYPHREPIADQSGWNKDFTREMRKVFEMYPDDLEVRSVLVEAIMGETPWKMWDLSTGAYAEGAGTEEAMKLLEDAFRDKPRSWEHPGMLHLYVHLMEMSPFPQRALRAGDKLREIMPDSGHLVHMPTHIDVLCGNYHDVVVWNQKAVVADRKYLADEGAMNIYTLYRLHNLHFVIYGAMFLGQYTPAIEAAEEIIACTPDAVMRVNVPPLADFFEGFMSMKQHVLVRFGKWHEILAQKLPDDQDVYCSTTAMMLYAKGVAHSILGNLEEAEKTRAAFLEAKARVPETRLVHNNTVTSLLGVAEAMLTGEFEYRRRNYDVAFGHLRRAVALNDGLLYDEPWGWMQPTRHALGALLLEQGQVAEAEAVYRADLGFDGKLNRSCQHPDNVWSLHGLHECLVRRGDKIETPLIKSRLDLALARAEVPIQSSCFCRRKAMAA
jgi:tetratricopeptide (TPR) repeat protein